MKNARIVKFFFKVRLMKIGDVNFIKDFEVVRQIGSGSFSNVFLCKKDNIMDEIDDTDDLFIIKEINTHELVKKYMVKHREYRFKRREAVKVEIPLSKVLLDGKVTPYQKNVLVNTEQEYYYKKLHDLTYSEIEILTSFDDKNIVKFYTWDKTEGIFYLRMEYCDGGDVYEYLKQNGSDFQFDKQKYNFLLEFCKQVSRGLEYIHEKNIIHRDIKLQNVLINYKNNKVEFKISDFGFACYDLSDTEASLNYDKDKDIICKKYYKLCGTPYYMAPEIVININNHKKQGLYCYNKLVDTWSFGICIYELVFGGFPFANSGSLEELKAFYESEDVQETIDLKITRREIITEQFKELILGMLRVCNNKRYSIHNISINFNQLKSIYVERDLEKEIADIINSEENAYNMTSNMKDIKHQFLTESEGLNHVEMSWQYV